MDERLAARCERLDRREVPEVRTLKDRLGAERYNAYMAKSVAYVFDIPRDELTRDDLLVVCAMESERARWNREEAHRILGVMSGR